jgi:hypothetical protein
VYVNRLTAPAQHSEDFEGDEIDDDLLVGRPHLAQLVFYAMIILRFL